MLSGHLLPIHFPPAPDELLSSWYVRLAHANHLKAETFCTVLWGRQHQIWNRDIDRLSPEWLVKELADRTGTSFDVAWKTTLKSYEGKLFTKIRQTGISPWILPVQMYHRKRRWPGLQFCPECLKEDAEPYFRKYWRLALYNVCHHHGGLLLDRCPSCEAPAMFYRRELGKTEELDVQPLSLCYQCDHDLRLATTLMSDGYEQSSAKLAGKTMMWLVTGNDSKRPESFFEVLHQICKILLATDYGERVRNLIADKTKISPIKLNHKASATSANTMFFERCSIVERYYLLGQALWILSNPEKRLNYLLKSNTLLTNKLYKDFRIMPSWYREILKNLPHRAIPTLDALPSFFK